MFGRYVCPVAAVVVGLIVKRVIRRKKERETVRHMRVSTAVLCVFYASASLFVHRMCVMTMMHELFWGGCSIPPHHTRCSYLLNSKASISNRMKNERVISVYSQRCSSLSLQHNQFKYVGTCIYGTLSIFVLQREKLRAKLHLLAARIFCSAIVEP